MTAIAFLVQKIGPYHHARLAALAASGAGEVTAVEFRPDDAVYGWEPVREDGGYHRIAVRPRGELPMALARLQPDVVVCAGYADPEINQAAAWALRSGVPLVTCSDSTWADEPRHGLKEALKRRALAAFDTALVSGARAHDYLASLGIGPERRFAPWDVVDNGHFARGAARARSDDSAARRRHGLPEKYFLCVARFVPKKNHAGLIAAYGRHVAHAGPQAWPLVLSGDGPLAPALRRAAAEAGVTGRVHFRGFVQYPDLPALYGLAGALVLPSLTDQWGLAVNEAMAAGLPVLVSERCGCTPELVRAGENGYTFSPDDGAALADRLDAIAALAPGERARLGRRSEEIITAFAPAAFAAGLRAAINAARARRRARAPGLTRMLVGLLALRPVAP